MLGLAAPGRRWPFAVYGLSMVLLFSASGLYHGVHFASPQERQFYERLDYSSIFLLIAGTNTPPMAVLLRGRWRAWCLGLMWAAALLGFVAIWLLPKPPMSLAVGLFLTLGWLGLAPVVHYYRAVGWRAMNGVWAGGACYTAGAVFELTRWPVIVPGWLQWHELFHFCDTVAGLIFFWFVLRHVLPRAMPEPEPSGERPGPRACRCVRRAGPAGVPKFG